MHPFMAGKLTLHTEVHLTNTARELRFTGVCSLMFGQGKLTSEAFLTNVAGVGLLPTVRSLVSG